MKQFLLLAAIYSLVIHQSQKNSKETGADQLQYLKKNASPQSPSNARLFAINSFRLGSGVFNDLNASFRSSFAKK